MISCTLSIVLCFGTDMVLNKMLNQVESIQIHWNRSVWCFYNKMMDWISWFFNQTRYLDLNEWTRSFHFLVPDAWNWNATVYLCTSFFDSSMQIHLVWFSFNMKNIYTTSWYLVKLTKNRWLLCIQHANRLNGHATKFILSRKMFCILCLFVKKE